MVMTRKTAVRFAWALAGCLLAVPAFAAVEAQLDRNRIVEGETVTLTILTDNPRQSLDADLGELESDFEILDRRSETQISIVNGQQTAVVRLLLTLEPRRSGVLQIAPLAFGQDRTRPLSLKVDPAPEPEPGEQPPVFIEVEVTPGEGPYWVHAQIGLVVRVFYQQNLTEAAISQPEPTPASVRLMQETPYQAERGGERYRVLERHYAVFPERSGELRIPPMQLTGRLVERQAGGTWQPTVRGRRIQVESEELVLTIEPRPAAFTGSEWQPARAYGLSQQVSAGESLRVGEPVTRTVIIDATGLEENMLVEPAWPEMQDVRIYPDQPQGITRDDGRWVLGHKEFRYAVVPEKEGKLVLPELRVEWWDTQQHRQRTAVLEAHTIQVQPSVLAPQSPPLTDPDASPASNEWGVAAPSAEPSHWRWLTALFAALWLATLAWALVRRPITGGRRKAVETALPEEEAQQLARLKWASRQGDAREARRVLQAWLRSHGPAAAGASLLDFAGIAEDENLERSIRDLDACGFRPGSSGEWDGRSFWDLFRAWLAKREADGGRAGPDLIDLYAPENRATALS